MSDKLPPGPKSTKTKKRRKRSRYPYTLKEKHLVILACTQWSLGLWSLALTQLWSQMLFTALSLIGLVWALLPQFGVRSEQVDPRLESGPCWKRLRAYPVFWCGLLVMLYLLLQFFNPAYGYEENPDVWRAFEIEHFPWLPSGVASPFEKMNPLRLALILSGVWLMQCYLKTAIIRRNSVIRILTFITFSLVGYGIFIIAQKQTQASGIYWNIEVFPNFIGSIPYMNRAAAILYLGMTLTMALYFLHLKSMRMELRHSGPHLVVMLATVFVYGLLWSTQSQAGFLIPSTILLAFALLTFIPTLRDGSTLMHKAILSIAMLAMVLMGIIHTQRVPDSELTIEQLGNIQEEIRNLNSNARAISTQITMEMFEEKWLMGWGGGSWRYVFPYYQELRPEIQYLDASKTVSAIWQDAHNDWAQYLSEQGVIGFVLFLFWLFWPLIESVSLIRSIHLTQVILCFGLIGVYSHAFLDLLLQNQCVLMFICMTGFFINRLNIEQIRTK